METAFVLGGGGVLGAFEVGMLRALSEAGIAPDVVVGTSVGAINGAFVAADPVGAAEWLSAVWQGEALQRAFRETIFGRAARLARSGTHLHSIEPLRQMLERALPGSFTDQIDRLARGLDQAGALVIFPEGGNWTPGRWHRGIRRLEQLGRDDLADRARNMPNLLPPRAGGALAAIAACPTADVIFVAHAGLDQLVSIADVWRSLPMDQVVHAKWWRVPVGNVPRDAGYESQVQWLYDWWQRIDTWITQNRPPGVQAPALPTGPSPGTVTD